MNRCLSDQALLQCYTGDGAADDLAHLRNCLTCAGRYKTLEADLAVISQALDAPPPHRSVVDRGVARWRVAVSAAAVLAAFVVGWSLRGRSLTYFGGAHPQVALHETAPSRPPIQLSALEPGTVKAGGATPAMYAAYVQDVFENPCSEANDPLDPGCP
jgi:hypothetical protein